MSGLLLALFANPASAYFDPNAGGFLFQLFAPLMAMVISVWMIGIDHLKKLWSRLKRRFDSEKESEVERGE